MKRIWMPMYWGDYLADTHHFTNAQHGSYLLLIGFYWCNGGLPPDEDEIRKIAKCEMFRWPKLRKLLLQKFTLVACENGSAVWKHMRIDAELAKSLEKSRVNSANAKRKHQIAADVSLTQSQSQSHPEEALASSGGRKRATRLEKDWWPSEANIQYALSHGLSLDRISIEAEKFRNYWTSKAGKDAAKLDWDATWQNWILKATENGHAKPRQSLGDRASELAEQARQLEFAESHRRKDEPLRGH